VNEYAWSIQAPPNIDRGADLVFQVHTKTAAGMAEEGVYFMWVVDWVDLNGWRHRGKSFNDLKILSKGRTGTAVIRVLAYNDEGHLVQVAKQELEVK
jgi:hypothetical protein